MQVIRFGLIGAGVASETHARELRKVSGASLEAIFARNGEKAAAFAAAYSLPKNYSDLDAFLNDRDIDAVIITTPNGLHLDYALAAAQAGKHVIVEKPLEITEPRATRIVTACREARARLFVIYQRRYSNAALQAKLDIETGKLGKIVLVNIVDNQFRHPSYYQDADWRGTRALEGGGCVITQSTHLLDLAQYLVGPISQVFSRTATMYHKIETEDVAVAVFEFANGALGTFSSSTAAYPGQRHLVTVSGTDGSIIINGEHDQIVFRQTRGSAQTEIPQAFSFADPLEPRDYPTDGQRAQLQDIVQKLQLGYGNASDVGDVLMAVQVTDAIYRSAAGEGLINVASQQPDQ